MIVDAFVFGGELDLLELRLSLLESSVDYFLVVEGNRTFSGEEKRYLLEDHRGRFRPWASQIAYVKVDDLPAPLPTRWIPEVWQRNCVLRGIAEIGSREPDDVVLVSDVDEVPFPAALEEARQLLTAGAGSVSLELETSCFRGNLVNDAARIFVTKAYRGDQLTNPHHQRYFETAPVTVRSAGRHLSSLLGPKELQAKLASFAHAERDNARDAGLRHLERCENYAVDMLGQALLRQIPAEEYDQILLALAELRPDLMAESPLPPRDERERYLKITRVRRLFGQQSVAINFIDEHTDSKRVDLFAALLPLLGLSNRVKTALRYRATQKEAEQLPHVPCRPEKPCRFCTGEYALRWSSK